MDDDVLDDREKLDDQPKEYEKDDVDEQEPKDPFASADLDAPPRDPFEKAPEDDTQPPDEEGPKDVFTSEKPDEPELQEKQNPQQTNQPQAPADVVDVDEHTYETPPAPIDLVSAFLAPPDDPRTGYTDPVINGRRLLNPGTGDQQVDAIRNALRPPLIEERVGPHGREYRVTEIPRNTGSALIQAPMAAEDHDVRPANELRENLIRRLGAERAAEITARFPSGNVNITVRDVDGAASARTLQHERGHADDFRQAIATRLHSYEQALREVQGRAFPTREALNAEIIERAHLNTGALDGNDPLRRLAQALHTDFATSINSRHEAQREYDRTHNTATTYSVSYDRAENRVTVEVQGYPVTSNP